MTTAYVCRSFIGERTRHKAKNLPLCREDFLEALRGSFSDSTRYKWPGGAQLARFFVARTRLSTPGLPLAHRELD
jgi:hypothetical protein